MYEYTSRVRYSETGPDLRITLSSLINRLQDCAVFHSDSVGRGIKPVGEAENAWVIVSWQIILKKMPRLGDEITTATFARRFHGIDADRDFTVRDENGEILAYAASRWIYFHFASQMPIRVPEIEIKSYGIDPGIETQPGIFLHRAPRHIKIPKDMKPVTGEPIAVQRYQIDNNGHVNNVQYLEMASLCVPLKRSYGEIRVEYSHQAVLGDTLTPYIYELPDQRIVVLRNQDDKVCAITAFLW